MTRVKYFLATWSSANLWLTICTFPLLYSIPLLCPNHQELGNGKKKNKKKTRSKQKDPHYDKIEVLHNRMIQVQSCDCISASLLEECAMGSLEVRSGFLMGTLELKQITIIYWLFVHLIIWTTRKKLHLLQYYETYSTPYPSPHSFTLIHASSISFVAPMTTSCMCQNI